MLAGLLTARLESNVPSRRPLVGDDNGGKRFAFLLARLQRRGRPGFTPEFPNIDHASRRSITNMCALKITAGHDEVKAPEATPLAAL